MLGRLRVVSSFPLGDRRESNLERSESARKVGRGQKQKQKSERRGWGEAEKEMEKRRLQTTHCFTKNLRGRWWPQYSDWPVLAFPSTGLTT